MDEIYAIECETIQAQYDVLCAEIAIFEKYHNMVDCVGVLNYDKMNAYIQESEIRISIPDNIKNKFIDANGKITPKSIIKGLIKLFISICNKIIDRIRGNIEIRKVINDKWTHVSFVFDINEYIQTFTSMQKSVQYTNKFWENAFGTTKNGVMRKLNPSNDTFSLDVDDAASKFINRITADNKSLETNMMSMDVDLLKDRIDQLHPKEYASFDKFAKVSRKAIQDVKEHEHPLSNNVFQYTYEKNEAIQLMNTLSSQITEFKKSLISVINVMKHNFSIIDKLNSVNHGDDDNDDYRISDFGPLQKALKADVEIYQRLLASVMEFHMFIVGRYGVYCVSPEAINKAKVGVKK